MTRITGCAFVPETDTPDLQRLGVAAGASHVLGRIPTCRPIPTSPQYWNALQFYQARAVGDNFQWSWRRVIRSSTRCSATTCSAATRAFRHAQSQIGLLLANHRGERDRRAHLRAHERRAGRNAEMRTSIGIGGRTQVQFSVSF